MINLRYQNKWSSEGKVLIELWFYVLYDSKQLQQSDESGILHHLVGYDDTSEVISLVTINKQNKY
jgi:hypothetical protein